MPDLSSQVDASFGDAVKWLRTRAGISMRELGEVCGLSAGYISKIEKGTANPSASIFAHLVEALKCSSLEIEFLLNQLRKGKNEI